MNTKPEDSELFDQCATRLLIITPNRYNKGEKVTISSHDMYSKMCREFRECFDGFNWDHTCVAGGLIESKYDPKIYRDSNLDVFVSVRS
jgi:hypothetical protein